MDNILSMKYYYTSLNTFFFSFSDSSLSLGQKKARIEMYVAKAMTGGMNPVMALNELLPGLKYECIQESSQKSLCPFIYAVHINNEVYKGSGNI